MTTREIISACSARSGLTYLIIGGHAVIAYGYSRATVDLDFLVSKTDRQAWLNWFTTLAYQAFHQHDNFVQLHSPAGGIDVDLMFVSPSTFADMLGAGRKADLGGVEVLVPSLEHLLALKLHVLKQGLPHRALGDMDDIVNLVSINSLDLRAAHWRSLFEKYGGAELYLRVLQATAS